MKTIAIRFVSVVGLLSIVAACTPISVVPHTGGMFTVIVTAASEKRTNELAMAKAQSICGEQNAKVRVIDKETIYQGIDASQQKLVKLAHDILPESKTAGPYTPADHEYKTTLTFKCE